MNVARLARTISVSAVDHRGARSVASVVLDPIRRAAVDSLPAQPAWIEPGWVIVELGLRSAPEGVRVIGADGRELSVERWTPVPGHRAWIAGVTLATLAPGDLSIERDGVVLATRRLVPGGRSLVHWPPGPVGWTIDDADGRGLWQRGSFEPRAVTVDPGPFLQAISPALELVRHGASFEHGLDVQVRIDHTLADRQVPLLVTVDARGRIDFVESELETSATGGTLRARLDAFATFVAVLDTAPPRIVAVRGGREQKDGRRVFDEREPVGSHGLRRPRWPALVVVLDDDGAGLPQEGPRVSVDGRLYPAQWDPERNRLFVDWFVDPGPGRHEVDVVAEDHGGHRVGTTIEVELKAASEPDRD